MVNKVLKAVGLAMGVAVIVTSVMKVVDPRDAVTMLGIGLACLGVTSFSKEE